MKSSDRPVPTVPGKSAMLPWMTEKLTACCRIKDPAHKIRNNVELSRILFGALLLFNYADIYGYVTYYKVMGFTTISGIVLAASLLLGILTPLVLITLFCGFFFRSPFGGSLIEQICMITAWGLLFFGAGRRYSVDYFLRRRSFTAALFSWIYVAAQPLSAKKFAQIRFCLLLSFACICFSAIVGHFGDEMWVSGDVLNLLFTMPYMSEHYEMFAAFSRTFPTLFDLFCKVSLLSVAIWELLFLPLMYFRWGRFFVMWEGLAFFVVCFLTVNLGWLGLFEVIMWVMLFNYPSLYSEQRSMINRLFTSVRRIPVLNLVGVDRLILEESRK